MSFYTVNYPTCEYCGDIFPFGDTDPVVAKNKATAAGWQAWPTAWIFRGVEVAWDFYCPTHLKDDDDGPATT